MGPQARSLLQTYWRRLTMVERAGGYYGTTFNGEHGVTQGGPLSPTIFNVVVDALVRHWVTGVIADAGEWSKLGKEGRHLSVRPLLLGHWPRRGDVEGNGGDFKSPGHGLHHLPQLPPWFTGGSRHRYCHPRGQSASADSGLEGGGPVHYLPGSAQGV